jgi:bacterioferritin
MQHGLWAAERVSQLGGEPDFNPATLAERSHTEYVTVDEADLKRMLTENLVAERIVITSYQEIIRWLGDADPTTRRLMEKILEQEEEHADDLNDLLGNWRTPGLEWTRPTLRSGGGGHPPPTTKPTTFRRP